MTLHELSAQAFIFFHKVMQRLQMYLLKPLFGSYGINFFFDPSGFYSFKNIHVGNDVFLGYRPVLIAANATIQIGSKVMFGPEVTIRGGNHRTDLVGRFMTEVRTNEKRPSDDQGVIIEDDVWIGTRAIILHGVKIGRGAIVGAGSTVIKSVPPYAIAAGNPAKIIRFRFDIDTIQKHEKLLYPPEKRFSRKSIEAFFSEMSS